MKIISMGWGLEQFIWVFLAGSLFFTGLSYSEKGNALLWGVVLIFIFKYLSELFYYYQVDFIISSNCFLQSI